MNGIVPGPLWLAIASATNSALTENRTLTWSSKIDTLTGKMNQSSKDHSDSERKGIGGDGVEGHPAHSTRKREGG